MADADLAPFFKNVNMQRLKRMQVRCCVNCNQLSTYAQTICSSNGRASARSLFAQLS